jgi:hypothetical protein
MHTEKEHGKGTAAMTTTWINDKPLEHTSHHGTTFKAQRSDLYGGVTVTKPAWPIAEAQFAADFGEFTAWHALCIFKQLNGFAGYDCIQYTIEN